MQRIVCATAALLCLLGVGAAQAAPVDDIKALLEQGRAAEAYALGRKHPELLGSAAFDFYFGIAATDSGHAGEGVLALERYLLNFPDSEVARVELARSYFALGDVVRAREEFEAVLRNNPPAGVRATVDRYLEAIRLRESRFQTTSLVWLEGGLGVDSNVNGGVGSANISVPVFGPVTVNAAGVRKGDNFLHVAGGAQISHPVAPGVAVFGSVLGESRLNQKEDQFDLRTLGATGGVSWLRNENTFRASLSSQNLAVDNQRYRNATGLTGEWLHALDELRLFTLAGQYVNLRYTGANEIRDADFLGAATSYRHAFVRQYQPVVELSLNFGREDNQRNRPDLGRDLWGARASVSATPAAKWGLAAGITYLGSRYHEADALLQTTRKDHYYGIDLTATYLFTRQFSVRAEAIVSRNDSNIALFEYDRNVFAIKARYEFK
ncbi:MAG: outer membrane beta-barrel protein [Burkholderiales bacterium]